LSFSLSFLFSSLVTGSLRRGRGDREGGWTEFGTLGRKEGGRRTGGGKKRGKKKLRKVAGTEIKECRWRELREVCTPHPPPCPSPSPSSNQSEMAEMSNPGIKVSRNGQFAVKY